MRAEAAEATRDAAAPGEAARAAHPRDAAEGGGGAPRESCPSCGETLAGDYCHACGEKRPGARDLTLRHFFGEAAQELTSVEHSKLFRTLRALLFRPGFLTREWVAGRRGLYLKPLNLCLLILALQVFAYSTRQVSMFDFGRILETEKQMLARFGERSSGVYDRMLERVSRERGLSREVVLEVINERWSRNVSLFQLPQILVYALLLQLLYVFSRRHLVEHVVFSLHFISFASLTVVLMWPVYYVVGVMPTAANLWVAAGKFLLDVTYLFFAARVFYRDSTGWALVKAPAMFAAYFVIYVLSYVAALLAALFSVARG